VILCSSLHDEGLEELTLRLVIKDYPDAHRTGRGKDGGVDVFSDFGNPPARGWQAKNYPDRTRWDKCRESLKAVMSGEDAPPHYTFVFPKRLSEAQHKFWRDTFLPEQLKLYPSLEVLDYWDDLATRLEGRPDLVDLLDDGALSAYFRDVMAQTAATGVNPLASAPDLAEGAEGVAGFAGEIGRDDPRFSYGIFGREAGVGDEELPEGRALFTIEHGSRRGLPRYAVTIRQGTSVTGTEAKPRTEDDVDPPAIWFAEDPEGEAVRERVRASLAKGRPIVVDCGPSVALEPRDVPDRFRSQTDSAGLLKRGRLDIGLSEPLPLSVTLDAGGGRHAKQAEVIPLYRVPANPGASESWAGGVGGCIVAFDLRPYGGPDLEGAEDGDVAVELIMSVSISIDGERPAQAIAGLGFARALGAADGVLLDCPGLLPADGIDVGGLPAPNEGATEVWEAGVDIATALGLLNRRDGVDRRIPSGLTERDRAIARQVQALLMGDGVRARMGGEFEVGLPPGTDPAGDRSSLLRTVRPMPDLSGQPTNLDVEQIVVGAEALEAVEREGKPPALRCRPIDGEAEIVMRAVEEESPGQ
jgi:hypothetical protein